MVANGGDLHLARPHHVLGPIGGCGGGIFTPPNACLEWSAREDSAGGQDAGRAVVASPQGDLAFSAGHVQGESGFWDREALVVAYDALSGSRVWRTTLPSSSDGPNEFFAIVASPGGERVFAVGSAHDGSDSPFHTDVLAAAFDAHTGVLLWSSDLDIGLMDSAYALALAPEGSRLFVAGGSREWSESSHAAVAAVDAESGAFLWHETYGGDSLDNLARDVATSQDGGTVYVTGTGTHGKARADFTTLALDAATGERKWLARYDGGAATDRASALTVADGRVIVAGTSEAGRDDWGDIAVVAYDALTGTQAWATRYTGTGLHYDGARDVAFANGRVFVTGVVHNFAQPYVPKTVYTYTPAQPITMALDASTGILLWHTIERGDDGITSGEGLALAVAPDGSGVYVAGRHKPGGSTDALVLAYDGVTGLAQWRGLNPSEIGIYDTAVGVALSPAADRVFVVGTFGDGEAGSRFGDATDSEDANGDVMTLAYHTWQTGVHVTLPGSG